MMSYFNRFTLFARSYLVIFLIASCFLLAVFKILNDGFSAIDGKLSAGSRYFKTADIKAALENIETLPPGEIKNTCSALMEKLKKRFLYDSAYAAMLLTEKSCASGVSGPAAAELLARAVSFSPSYARAYYVMFISSLRSLEIKTMITSGSRLFYEMFLSPENLLKSMNFILLAFISFIFMQIVFFGAVYSKYRRLLKHEVSECGIDAASLSIAPYLSDREKGFMVFLSQNLVISLILIVFYCYFSTGFGKVMKICGESVRFLKNPYEFCALNDIEYNHDMTIRFPEYLKKAFEKEKYSADFNHYLNGLSRLVINDRNGASQFFVRISAYSFLVTLIPRSDEIKFLSDSDLYFAFFSPMRSNPLFMIAVLLNILLIIIFSAVIRRTRKNYSRIRASVCDCGAITCADCRTHVGLCNRCLAPLDKPPSGGNEIRYFYPLDSRKIFYMSFIFPGAAFYYFGHFVHAAFYSFVIPFLLVLNIAGFTPFFHYESAFTFVLAISYSLYAVENYYLFKEFDDAAGGGDASFELENDVLD